MYNLIVQSCVDYEKMRAMMMQASKVNDRDITFKDEVVFKKGTLLLHHASVKPIPFRWWQILEWFKPSKYVVVSELKYRSDGWDTNFANSETGEVFTNPFYPEIDLCEALNIDPEKIPASRYIEQLE